MDNKIFGYDWEDIQAMQQKRYSRPTVAAPATKPLASAADIELLGEHGEDGLHRLQFHGALDRLNNSGLLLHSGRPA